MTHLPFAYLLSNSLLQPVGRCLLPAPANGRGEPNYRYR